MADTGSPSQVNMMKLVDCVNQHYIPKNMTWATAMADDPASVKASAVPSLLTHPSPRHAAGPRVNKA